MKKALVVTYYWPPAGGSGVQRWLKFVKYFRDFGVEPIVYTVKNPNYPITDETLKNDIPEGVMVLEHPIFEPNNVLSFFGKKNKNTGLLNPNPTFYGKILQYIRANYFIPDARKFWVKPSVNYLKKFLKENSIDVVITTGPPHSVHLIGLKLKKELNCKWIADFRDPMSTIFYNNDLQLTSSTKLKIEKLEKEILKSADRIITVSEFLKKELELNANNVQVVTNGFDKDTTSLNREELDEKFTISHIGQLPHNSNPKNLWSILKEVCSENSDFKSDLQINLIGNVSEIVLEDITKNGLDDNLVLKSYIPHNEAIKLQTKSQVLLLLIPQTKGAEGIITGKVFEYLMAKRPILAIAPSKGDLKKIIIETKAGYVVDFDDSETLKKRIVTLYKDYKKGTLVCQSVNIDQFHRRQLTKQVSQIIHEITN